MKEYVMLTIEKLTSLVEIHPTADIRYNKNSVNPQCGCKILSTDIKYDSNTNTIYIG